MDAQIFDQLMTDRKWNIEPSANTSNMMMSSNPDLSAEENQKQINSAFKSMRESYTYKRGNVIIYINPQEILDLAPENFEKWFEDHTSHSFFYEDHPEIEEIINERLSRFNSDLILDCVKDFHIDDKASFLTKEVKSIMWSACMALKKQSQKNNQ